MEHVAAPEVTTTPEHKALAPSRNVTVPVGAAPPEVIVAVKVTFWPEVDGFGVDDNAAVAVTLLTVCVTVPLAGL